MDTLACTYAALLVDASGQEPTADKIKAAIAAAGLEDNVRNTLPILFARYLQKHSIQSLMQVAAASSAAVTVAPAAAASGASAPAASGKAAKEEKKEEEEDDMGFDLFG